MRNAVALGILTIALMLASIASADVTIRIKETNDLGSKKPTVSTGTLRFNAVAMTTRWDAKPGDHGRVIFRGDKDLLWMVDDGKKTYQQVDKAFIDQAAAQVTDAQAQMKAQLEKMPPDQRAQAEEMMKKYGGAVASAGGALKLDYRKSAATRVINGVTCTKYDAYLGEDLISHAWVAPYSAMKLVPSDAAVFTKMADFMQKMTSSFGKTARQDYIPMHELGGIPLLMQDVDGGKVTSETLVESVSREPIPAGSFDVPAGYKLEPMPGAKPRK